MLRTNQKKKVSCIRHFFGSLHSEHYKYVKQIVDLTIQDSVDYNFNWSEELVGIFLNFLSLSAQSLYKSSRLIVDNQMRSNRLSLFAANIYAQPFTKNIDTISRPLISEVKQVGSERHLCSTQNNQHICEQASKYIFGFFFFKSVSPNLVDAILVGILRLSGSDFNPDLNRRLEFSCRNLQQNFILDVKDLKY